MRDSGIAGMVLAFLVVGMLITIVTGDLIHWVPLILAIVIGVMAANSIMNR